jgi:hypothetical protein
MGVVARLLLTVMVIAGAIVVMLAARPLPERVNQTSRGAGLRVVRAPGQPPFELENLAVGDTRSELVEVTNQGASERLGVLEVEVRGAPALRERLKVVVTRLTPHGRLVLYRGRSGFIELGRLPSNRPMLYKLSLTLSSTGTAGSDSSLASASGSMRETWSAVDA